MADRGSTKNNVVPLKGQSCPQCRRPAVNRFWPFCSSRCADADLGRWLNGEYRITTNGDGDLPEDP
jgi:endogenous inhibitor of DNA gyrase (YacG/DUF329 family)